MDTAKTIEALRADFIILRHSMAGAPGCWRGLLMPDY